MAGARHRARVVQPAPQPHGNLVGRALSHFLRRLSRQTVPAAATLAGEHWLNHLDACAATNEFTAGVGRVLIEAPYRPAPAYDTAALIALVRRWVRVMLERRIAHA